MTGPVWMYRPSKHKTASRGKSRSIPLEPKCQEVISQYVGNGSPYVFDRNNNQKRMSSVFTPVDARTDLFTSNMYLRELKIGVDAAIADGVITEEERWTSHQLRHRAGTDARAMFGIDATQLLLGHSDVKTTEWYAIPDDMKMFDFSKNRMIWHGKTLVKRNTKRTTMDICVHYSFRRKNRAFDEHTLYRMELFKYFEDFKKFLKGKLVRKGGKRRFFIKIYGVTIES